MRRLNRAENNVHGNIYIRDHSVELESLKLLIKSKTSCFLGYFLYTFLKFWSQN